MATEAHETYAAWLLGRMEERGLTQRSFAKVLNPADPETARRTLRRHLKGVVPIKRTRKIYARALGTGGDLGPSDDAEGDKRNGG